MVHLLSECSVFLKVDAGLDNYLQLTGWCKLLMRSLGALFSDHSPPGIPLSELDTKTPDHTLKSQIRKPSDITIVRSRMFYAKPATTAKGLVHAGFKHIRRSKVFLYIYNLGDSR